MRPLVIEQAAGLCGTSTIRATRPVIIARSCSCQSAARFMTNAWQLAQLFQDWWLTPVLSSFACVLACGARACLRDVPAQQVIFLHWFHHATVMLYCWHAYHNRVAPGLWFAAMNFLVHSIMCHNPQPAPRGAAPGARAQRSGRHGAGSRRLKRGAVAGTCITARWRAG